MLPDNNDIDTDVDVDIDANIDIDTDNDMTLMLTLALALTLTMTLTLTLTLTLPLTLTLTLRLKPQLTWYIFTGIGKTTLLSDIAGIVKPECCTCSQRQVLLQNIHGIELFSTCCI